LDATEFLPRVAIAPPQKYAAQLVTAIVLDTELVALEELPLVNGTWNIMFAVCAMTVSVLDTNTEYGVVVPVSVAMTLYTE
jgi:hypothetical protein